MLEKIFSTLRMCFLIAAHTLALILLLELYLSIYLSIYTHTHVRQAHIYVSVESEVCAKEFLKQDTKRITYDKKIDTFDNIKIMNLFFQSLH